MMCMYIIGAIPIPHGTLFAQDEIVTESSPTQGKGDIQYIFVKVNMNIICSVIDQHLK